MNKYRAILFLSILKTILQLTNCKRISEFEENFFYTVNTRLQDTVNKLFILTRLNKAYATDYTNRMHLTMHASMKSIAEKYYEHLKKTKASSRWSHNFKPNHTLFNLDEILEELSAVLSSGKESPLDYTEKFIKKMPKLFSKSIKFKFPDKTDPVIYLREYLSTIKHLDLGELAAPPEHIHKMFLNLTKGRHRIRRRRMNLSLWKPRNSSDPLASYKTRRLYAGKHTRITSYPFIVSVHLRNKFICTGTILSTEMVITAASCLHELFKNKLFLHINPDSVGIRVGSDYVDKEGLWVYIDRVFFNPTYNPTTLTGNLAIMRTSSLLHLKRRSKKVKRISYQTSEDLRSGGPINSSTIVMLGWGDMFLKDNQEPLVTPLKFSRIPVYDFRECTIIYSSKFVSDKHFCAGYSNERSGACKRDVGGPAVINDKIVGVVSFGPPTCGTPDAPTVFTSLGYYSDWINSTIKENSHKIPAPRRPLIMGNSSALVRSHLDDEIDDEHSFPDKMRSQDLRSGVIKSQVTNLKRPKKRTDSKYKYTDAIRVIAFVLSKILNINDYEYEQGETQTNPNSYLWPSTSSFDPYQHHLYNLSILKTATSPTTTTTTTTVEPINDYFKNLKEYTDIITLPDPHYLKERLNYVLDLKLNNFKFDNVERTTNGEVYSNDDENDFYMPNTEPTQWIMDSTVGVADDATLQYYSEPTQDLYSASTKWWMPAKRQRVYKSMTFPPTRPNIFIDRARDVLYNNFKSDSSEKKMTDQAGIVDLFRMIFPTVTPTPYREYARAVITSNWEISVEDIPPEMLNKRKRTSYEETTTIGYRNRRTSSKESEADEPVKGKNSDSSGESIDEFKGKVDETGELSSSEIAAVHNESLESEEGLPIEFRRYFAEHQHEDKIKLLNSNFSSTK